MFAFQIPIRYIILFFFLLVFKFTNRGSFNFHFLFYIVLFCSLNLIGVVASFCVFGLAKHFFSACDSFEAVFIFRIFLNEKKSFCFGFSCLCCIAKGAKLCFASVRILFLC